MKLQKETDPGIWFKTTRLTNVTSRSYYVESWQWINSLICRINAIENYHITNHYINTDIEKACVHLGIHHASKQFFFSFL